MADLEIVILDGGFTAAIAAAKPHRVLTGLFCAPDNDESTKALVCNIDERGQGDLPTRLLRQVAGQLCESGPAAHFST